MPASLFAKGGYGTVEFPKQTVPVYFAKIRPFPVRGTAFCPSQTDYACLLAGISPQALKLLPVVLAITGILKRQTHYRYDSKRINQSTHRFASFAWSRRLFCLFDYSVLPINEKEYQNLQQGLAQQGILFT
jgi:hypothetical protein